MEIIRKIVNNTHDLYLNAKQADKAVWELATRANNPVVRELMVDTLNLANAEVKIVQASEKAERIREMMKDFDAEGSRDYVARLTPIPKKRVKVEDGGEDTGEETPTKSKTRAPAKAKVMPQNSESPVPTPKKEARASKAKSGRAKAKVPKNESIDSDADTASKFSIDDNRVLIAQTGIGLKELRALFRRLSPLSKATFKYDDWLTYQMICMDSDKVYTLADLEDSAIL